MSKEKKELNFTKFIGVIASFTFWFILSWIIASIIPSVWDKNVTPDLLGNIGWKIASAFLNLLMMIVMISFLITLIKFMIQFLINSFSFSKKNWGGKILLPILGIIMIIATIIIFSLVLAWLIIMFKEVIFNFENDAWLINQLAGKHMFVSTGGTFLLELMPNHAINSAFPIYVTIFVFLLIWTAAGIIYTVFNRALTKKTT